MVQADNIVMWEPNESTLENKFQTVAVHKDFGLNVSFDKCAVMKDRGHGKYKML
jgi:hypothetical protein